MSPLDIAREAFVAALDKKASRPVLMDVRGMSDVCDYQFICSGENDRQTRAIADAIESRCRQLGKVKPYVIEGKQSGHWILLDYGATVVHIFYMYLRDFYALEELFPKAKYIDLKPAATAVAASAQKAPGK